VEKAFIPTSLNQSLKVVSQNINVTIQATNSDIRRITQMY